MLLKQLRCGIQDRLVLNNMKQYFLQQHSSNNHSSGFTLVELMVSLSLFTVVVLASVGAVFAINNAAHQVDAMRNVLDNLNFAVDSMTRTIHTAEAVSCGGASTIDNTKRPSCTFDDGGNNKTITVRSTIGLPKGQSQVITYALRRTDGVWQIVKTVDGGVSVAITAPEINIETLKFYVNGADSADNVEPSVAFMIKGVAQVGADTAPFALQSFVSVRVVE